MTGAEIQALVDDIPCDLCNISPGMAPYAVLAALIDISTGNPVPDTTQALLTEANCLTCLVPPGLVPALMIQAIRAIPVIGGSSCLLCSIDTDPTDPPDCPCALHYRKDNSTLFYWYAELGQWFLFG